ncbi:MAG: DUF3127 domain-containing protein [Prevotellaceae bacterium]|nr:DUF3127 domain-containing protein [Candidatus Minthosoma caballi]
MEITGTIIHVLETRSGVSKNTGNNWVIAQYVLETNGNYPRRMVFEVFGEDRIKAMDIKQDEALTVSFDIDSREYQGRWFNQIRAWKVERHNDAVPAEESKDASANNPFDDLDFMNNEEKDEPPF